MHRKMSPSAAADSYTIATGLGSDQPTFRLTSPGDDVAHTPQAEPSVASCHYVGRVWHDQLHGFQSGIVNTCAVGDGTRCVDIHKTFVRISYTNRSFLRRGSSRVLKPAALQRALATSSWSMAGTWRMSVHWSAVAQ